MWIEGQNLDLLAINETRLDKSITDDQIYLNGYDVIRLDRNRNGGGVAIYLRTSTNYRNRSDLLPDGIEAICIDILKHNSKPFSVISCYRPPNTNPDIFYNDLQTAIKKIDYNCTEMYILGDLNSNLLPTNDNRAKRLLVSTCELYQLGPKTIN